jgi:pimeloyl-ACP methyl ester carboxylesterase
VLNHRVEGAGPAVVLLHAGVADLRMWDEQAAALARDHTVVRCDLRGFGGSDLAPGATYGDAEDVLALLDDLGVARCALVAASYGGYVALQVASARPEQVERLVLLAPLAELVEPDESLRAVWAEEGALVEAGDLRGAAELNARTWVGPEAGDAARARVAAMQLDALTRQVAAGEVDNRELPVTYERLTMPTTVLSGGHDQAFFRRTAAALADRLPAADLVELPWAGHLPTLERPVEMTDLLLELLRAR